MLWEIAFWNFRCLRGWLRPGVASWIFGGGVSPDRIPHAMADHASNRLHQHAKKRQSNQATRHRSSHIHHKRATRTHKRRLAFPGISTTPWSALIIPPYPILKLCTKNPAMLYNVKVSKGGKSATAPRHSGTNSAFPLCNINKKRGYFTPLCCSYFFRQIVQHHNWQHEQNKQYFSDDFHLCTPSLWVDCITLWVYF